MKAGSGKIFIYRINTFTITLPPLRERIEDIPLLAEHFLQRAKAKVNKRVESISPRAIALLRNYAWPGNLRELENIIERSVVLTSSMTIEAEHLPLHVQDSLGFKPRDGFMEGKSRAIRHFEKHALSSYLLEAQGNKAMEGAAGYVPEQRRFGYMLKHKISACPPKIHA